MTEEDLRLVHSLAEKEGAVEAPTDLSLADTNAIELPDLEWRHYDNPPVKLVVTNTGHTVNVGGKWECNRSYLRDGPFKGNYVFAQMHFHWGPSDDTGSEHSVDQRKLPLEMHVVHINRMYRSQELALKEKDGVAIVTYLFEIQDEDNADIEPIISALPLVSLPQTSTQISPVPIGSLLVQFQRDYLLYWGSVSSTSCHHVILWLICRVPLGISSNQLSKFRQVRDVNGQFMVKNYRETHPRRNQTLFHVSPSSKLETTLLSVYPGSAQVLEELRQQEEQLADESEKTAAEEQTTQPAAEEDGEAERLSSLDAEASAAAVARAKDEEEKNATEMSKTPSAEANRYAAAGSPIVAASTPTSSGTTFAPAPTLQQTPDESKLALGRTPVSGMTQAASAMAAPGVSGTAAGLTPTASRTAVLSPSSSPRESQMHPDPSTMVAGMTPAVGQSPKAGTPRGPSRTTLISGGGEAKDGARDDGASTPAKTVYSEVKISTRSETYLVKKEPDDVTPGGPAATTPLCAEETHSREAAPSDSETGVTRVKGPSKTASVKSASAKSVSSAKTSVTAIKSTLGIKASKSSMGGKSPKRLGSGIVKSAQATTPSKSPSVVSGGRVKPSMSHLSVPTAAHALAGSAHGTARHEERAPGLGSDREAGHAATFKSKTQKELNDWIKSRPQIPNCECEITESGADPTTESQAQEEEAPASGPSVKEEAGIASSKRPAANDCSPCPPCPPCPNCGANISRFIPAGEEEPSSSQYQDATLETTHGSKECPPGYAKPDKTTGKCPPGYKLVEERNEPESGECPPGYARPDESTGECPVGYEKLDAENLPSKAEKKHRKSTDECPPGFDPVSQREYEEERAKPDETSDECPTGFVKPEEATGECPPGYQRVGSDAGGHLSEQLKPDDTGDECPPGFTRPDETTGECPPGYERVETDSGEHLSEQAKPDETDEECPPGFTKPDETTGECPPGYERVETDAGGRLSEQARPNETGGECPPGFAKPNKTTGECPPGYQRVETDFVEHLSEQLRPDDTGDECPPGFAKPDEMTGECPPGYQPVETDSGEHLSEQPRPNDTGDECPPGFAKPDETTGECPPGYHRVGTDSGECLSEQPRPDDTGDECPPGFAIPDNTTGECPPGYERVETDPGERLSEQARPDETGDECPPGFVKPDETTGECPPGYQRAGTASENRLSGQEKSKDADDECPPGYVKPDAFTGECPPGYEPVAAGVDIGDESRPPEITEQSLPNSNEPSLIQEATREADKAGEWALISGNAQPSETLPKSDQCNNGSGIPLVASGAEECPEGFVKVCECQPNNKDTESGSDKTASREGSRPCPPGYVKLKLIKSGDAAKPCPPGYIKATLLEVPGGNNCDCPPGFVRAILTPITSDQLSMSNFLTSEREKSPNKASGGSKRVLENCDCAEHTLGLNGQPGSSSGQRNGALRIASKSSPATSKPSSKQTSRSHLSSKEGSRSPSTIRVNESNTRIPRKNVSKTTSTGRVAAEEGEDPVSDNVKEPSRKSNSVRTNVRKSDVIKSFSDEPALDINLSIPCEDIQAHRSNVSVKFQTETLPHSATLSFNTIPELKLGERDNRESYVAHRTPVSSHQWKKPSEYERLTPHRADEGAASEVSTPKPASSRVSEQAAAPEVSVASMPQLPPSAGLTPKPSTASSRIANASATGVHGVESTAQPDAPVEVTIKEGDGTLELSTRESGAAVVSVRGTENGIGVGDDLEIEALAKVPADTPLDLPQDQPAGISRLDLSKLALGFDGTVSGTPETKAAPAPEPKKKRKKQQSPPEEPSDGRKYKYFVPPPEVGEAGIKAPKPVFCNSIAITRATILPAKETIAEQSIHKYGVLPCHGKARKAYFEEKARWEREMEMKMMAEQENQEFQALPEEARVAKALQMAEQRKLNRQSETGPLYDLPNKRGWPFESFKSAEPLFSPINIILSCVLDRPLAPLFFEGHFYERARSQVTNTGETLEVRPVDPSCTPVLRGGPLCDDFIFDCMHYHWNNGPGPDCLGGSHRINGQRFCMEAHMIHFKAKYKCMAEALRHEGGICCVAFMLHVGGVENECFEKFCKELNKVETPGSKTILGFNGLEAFCCHACPYEYITYPGTLIARKDLNNVIWIVYPKPVPVCCQNVTQFQKLARPPKCNESAPDSEGGAGAIPTYDVANRPVLKSIPSCMPVVCEPSEALSEPAESKRTSAGTASQKVSMVVPSKTVSVTIPSGLRSVPENGPPAPAPSVMSPKPVTSKASTSAPAASVMSAKPVTSLLSSVTSTKAPLSKTSVQPTTEKSIPE